MSEEEKEGGRGKKNEGGRGRAGRRKEDPG